MHNISEEYSSLAVANIYHHEYFPYIQLYGETIFDFTENKLIQVSGACRTGKTTTVRRAIQLSEGRLSLASTDSVIFDASKSAIVARNKPFDGLGIALLIILTTNNPRTVSWNEMDLSIKFCKEVLELSPIILKVQEGDVDGTSNALLSQIFSILQ